MHWVRAMGRCLRLQRFHFIVLADVIMLLTQTMLDFTRGTNQQLQFLLKQVMGPTCTGFFRFNGTLVLGLSISHILTVGFLWRRFSLSDTKASCFNFSGASFNTLWWLVYRSDKNIPSAGLDWGCRKNSQFSPKVLRRWKFKPMWGAGMGFDLHVNNIEYCAPCFKYTIHLPVLWIVPARHVRNPTRSMFPHINLFEKKQIFQLKNIVFMYI